MLHVACIMDLILMFVYSCAAYNVLLLGICPLSCECTLLMSDCFPTAQKSQSNQIFSTLLNLWSKEGKLLNFCHQNCISSSRFKGQKHFRPHFQCLFHFVILLYSLYQNVLVTTVWGPSTLWYLAKFFCTTPYYSAAVIRENDTVKSFEEENRSMLLFPGLGLSLGGKRAQFWITSKAL